MTHAIRLLAGVGAREHIRRHGLSAQDVAGVAAAAGGPKGLAFLSLDAWLFGDWLAHAPRPRVLAGASIGAWRMAAAVHPDGPAATRRLGEAYLERQRYRLRPPAHEVSAACADVVQAMLGDAQSFIDAATPDHQLAVVTARGRGALATHSRRRDFARPALSNLVSRDRLGGHLQRVLFTHRADSGEAAVPPWPDTDTFDTTQVPLHAGNAAQALLASGTIPLVAEAVRNPADAPPGLYWDGGLIDYHLMWPWQRLDGLLLYPHFAPYITPGWLDKGLPWRRSVNHQEPPGLHKALLIVPSATLLARLPGGRLPERQDFHVHGIDHDRRIAQWRRAMGECEAMVDDLAQFVRRPDPTRLEPLETVGASR
jgi:hypothetical protein